jgi:dextranase
MTTGQFGPYRILCCLFALMACLPAAALSGTVITSTQSDRARYAPGDTVMLTVTCEPQPANAVLALQWTYLGEPRGERITIPIAPGAAQTSVTWVAPADDYRGYMADIDLMQADTVADHATFAVDVSSDWARFPRYGFVSGYGLMDAGAIDAVVKKLNRYHINGIQFYDWGYKHHMPLKGTPENPASQWNDIANRVNYFSTVKGYIESAHHYNMWAMAYNLLYGAYSDAGTDGVQLDAWGLFKDANHATRYYYDLPSGWASDLYFMDPSNEQWKSYLFAQEKKVFQALAFDGWHVDQVGDPGAVYNYSGQRLRDADYFQQFLTDAKTSLKVRLVMNAVNQYGQTGIANAPVDFLYTEVWDPTTTYGALKSLTESFSIYAGGPKNTVMAAYMDYGLANTKTTFNTPGVLFTDAVIFAAGGAHLELGDHMLVHEYFPNANLTMKPELEKQLAAYYDFAVAYQNLLRDSVKPAQVTLVGADLSLFSKSDQKGSIWYFSRTKGARDIVHLINLIDAAHTLWRDNMGTQSEPAAHRSILVSFAAGRTVKKIWMASPDTLLGSACSVPFTQADGRVSITVPYIKYWDMLVIEYADGSTPVKDFGMKNDDDRNGLRAANFPSPVHTSTTIKYTLPGASQVSLRIYDALGRVVSEFNADQLGAGDHTYVWDASRLASGVYFYRILTSSGGTSPVMLPATRKLILSK